MAKKEKGLVGVRPTREWIRTRRIELQAAGARFGDSGLPVPNEYHREECLLLELSERVDEEGWATP